MIRIYCDGNARQRLTRLLTTIFETKIDSLDLHKATDSAFEVLEAVKDSTLAIREPDEQVIWEIMSYVVDNNDISEDTLGYIRYLVTGLRHPIQKKIPKSLAKKMCVLVVKNFV